MNIDVVELVPAFFYALLVNDQEITYAHTHTVKQLNAPAVNLLDEDAVMLSMSITHGYNLLVIYIAAPSHVCIKHT